MIINNSLTIHTQSSSFDPANPGYFDRVLDIYNSPEVQAAAHVYKAKLARLVSDHAYRSAIATAIEFAPTAGLVPTADVVVGVLEGMAEDLDDETEAANADRVEFDLSEKTARARHRPLLEAVSRVRSRLAAELGHVVTAIESRGRAAAMGLGFNGRHAELKRAGLTDAQALAIDPTAFDPEAQNVADRLRVVDLSALINRLRHADVTRDADLTLIAGIDPELDAAIAFRRAESTAA